MKNYINFFKRVLKNDNLSHLYLLHGENMTDLENAAKEIFYFILKNGKEDLLLKDKIMKNHSENIYYINGRDGIKKEDIHALQIEFSKTSNYTNYRFYVITDFDTINQSAANSMLKFLEEPIADKVVGFLLSKNKDLILPTILSRCQTLYISVKEQKEYINDLNDIMVDDFLKEVSSIFTRDKEIAKTLLIEPSFLKKAEILKEIFSSFSSLGYEFSLNFHQKILEIARSNYELKELSETIFVFLLDILKEEKKDMVFQSCYQQIKECKKSFKKQTIKNLICLCSNFNEIQNFQNNSDLQLYSFLIQIDKERLNA